LIPDSVLVIFNGKRATGIVFSLSTGDCWRWLGVIKDRRCAKDKYFCIQLLTTECMYYVISTNFTFIFLKLSLIIHTSTDRQLNFNSVVGDKV